MPGRLVPLLVFALIFTGGCTAGIRGGKKYARFAPDAAEIIEPAHHSGDHFIVVRMAHEEGLARWPDTKRTLRAGDPVGFKRDEKGHLLAVAGSATRNLEPVPVGIAYIAWYHRQDRPLHSFAYAVRDRVGAVAGAAGQAALVSGAVIGVALIEDAPGDDCEDDDEPEWMKRQQKRRR